MNKWLTFNLVIPTEDDYTLRVKMTDEGERFVLFASSEDEHFAWNRETNDWEAVCNIIRPPKGKKFHFPSWRLIWQMLDNIELPCGCPVFFDPGLISCSGEIGECPQNYASMFRTFSNPFNAKNLFILGYFAWPDGNGPPASFAWSEKEKKWILFEGDEPVPEEMFSFPNWIQAWMRAEEAMHKPPM